MVELGIVRWILQARARARRSNYVDIHMHVCLELYAHCDSLYSMHGMHACLHAWLSVCLFVSLSVRVPRSKFKFVDHADRPTDEHTG